MINEDVRDRGAADARSRLAGDDRRYARLSQRDATAQVGQGQQRINIRGEIVVLDLEGELSDAAWAKEQIARAKQTLPNGYCGRPLQQTARTRTRA